MRRPNYALRDRAGQPLALPTALSVRVAPSLIGLGLLEAVPEQQLERLALAQQGDPDGVAGRLQIVADAALKKIFGKDKVSMFEMNKHLAAHLK